jgi:hypothetical protein
MSINAPDAADHVAPAGFHANTEQALPSRFSGHRGFDIRREIAPNVNVRDEAGAIATYEDLVMVASGLGHVLESKALATESRGDVHSAGKEVLKCVEQSYGFWR